MNITYNSTQATSLISKFQPVINDLYNYGISIILVVSIACIVIGGIGWILCPRLEMQQWTTKAKGLCIGGLIGALAALIFLPVIFNGLLGIITNEAS